MPEVRVDKRARRDILEHLLYLYDVAGVEVASQFDKDVNYTFGQLLRFQGMGTPVDTERPQLKGLRKWRVDDFERYLIFYLPKPYGVRIIHVKHSSQNWWTQLKVRK
jgi:toxin ParE1/3/4